MSAVDYIALVADRAALDRRASTARTADYDALIMPTVPIMAPPIAAFADDADFTRLNALILRNPSLINFLDGCAITVPIAGRARRRSGLMLIGRMAGPTTARARARHRGGARFRASMSARLSIVLLALALALGGCATGPSYPLLSPLATAKSFGYAEAPRGENRYGVTYVTPARLAFGAAGPSGSDAEAARTLGYDMAVWRAAQLAAASGFEGFRVSDRQADVTFYPDPLDLDFPPSYWGPGWWRRRDPFWGMNDPWPPPRLLLAARVTIDVRLVHAPGPDDYDTAGVLAQLAHTYPGADGTPPKP